MTLGKRPAGEHPPTSLMQSETIASPVSFKGTCPATRTAIVTFRLQTGA